MRIPLSVPDIGDAEKIEIAGWKVAAGAEVVVDQELCELVTDKAAFPLESPYNGKIVSVEKKAGDCVHVGDILAYIEKL